MMRIEWVARCGHMLMRVATGRLCAGGHPVDCNRDEPDALKAAVPPDQALPRGHRGFFARPAVRAVGEKRATANRLSQGQPYKVGSTLPHLTGEMFKYLSQHHSPSLHWRGAPNYGHASQGSRNDIQTITQSAVHQGRKDPPTRSYFLPQLQHFHQPSHSAVNRPDGLPSRNLNGHIRAALHAQDGHRSATQKSGNDHHFSGSPRIVADTPA